MTKGGGLLLRKNELEFTLNFNFSICLVAPTFLNADTGVALDQIHG